VIADAKFERNMSRMRICFIWCINTFRMIEICYMHMFLPDTDTCTYNCCMVHVLAGTHVRRY